MSAFELILHGMADVVTNPLTLLYLLAGTFGGIIFGAIPGLTGALGVSLMLPFTFSMPPTQGIAMLIGIYVGGVSGGLFASIMLNIPGNAAAIVTCFDGAPMARNGHPYRALSYGATASLIGGIFSGIVMILVATKLARFGLMFGSWEYFALGIMGLAVVVSLCSEDMIKGLISAILGMILAMVGLDKLSFVERFTFGYWRLSSGFTEMTVLMGLFALGEILVQLKNLGQPMHEVQSDERRTVIPQKGSFKGLWRTISISSIIGTLIGILPGVGQSTAALVAYNQAKNSSKTPEKFGTGCAEGIVAPESANNAVCGGALIPMMTLGIPGDTITAMLMSGLIVHGLAPGAMLFDHNPEVVGTIYFAYILACVAMYVLYIIFIRHFIKILSTPMNYMFPVILLMCLIGALTANNRIFDIWVFCVMGVLGYIFNRVGIPLAPLTLGYVLGPTVELNFRTAIVAFQGDVTSLFTRPIAIVLLIVAGIMLLWPTLKAKISRKRG